MIDLKKRIGELEAEVARLASELDRASERAKDLEDTRKAMLFLLEDINESRADIIKAKNEWEETFDSISDMLFIHDEQMRIIRCNRAYQSASGVPFSAIVGRPYYEVFPKMKGPFAVCLGKFDPASGPAGDEEEAVYLNRTYRVKVFLKKDDLGSRRLSIHVLEDITEEKRAAGKEKALYNFSTRVMDNLELNYRLRVVCETAVEFGYMMAWIGLLKEDSGEVVPMAHAGFEGALSSGVRYDSAESGAGPIGTAVRTKKPQVVNRMESGMRHEPFSSEAVKKGCRSSASFPVIEDNEVIAVLNIYSGEDEFPSRDFDLLSTFANQAASYIKVSWLFVKLKESADKIREEMELSKHLLTIAEATANTTDIDSLMDKAVERLKSIMGCELCLAYLWDPERKIFSPLSARGLAPEAVPVFRVEPLSPDARLVKDAFESRRPSLYRAHEPGEGTATSPEGAPPAWVDGRDAIAVIPLLGKEGTLGVMFCVYKRSSPLFSTLYSSGFGKRDIEVLTGISSQVSTALEVARLYKDSIDKTMDLSRKIEVIQAMHEIDTSILSIRDPHDILETAARMVGKLLFCDRATISLVDRERGGFVYEAGYGITSLKKGHFVRFEETAVTEVVRSGRAQYTANLGEAKGLARLERMLLKEGFLSHMRVPLVLKGEVIGVLNVGAKRVAAFSSEDFSTMEKLASQISVALDNSRLLTDLKELFIGTVKTLSRAIDAKSPWTSGHSERVTEIALGIGRELAFSDEEMKDLELSGLLHDIGKLGTYEYILDKPGRLTEDEVRIMRQHPAKGAEILAPIKELKKVVPSIRHHHESYDGSGYPEGLKGDSIPLNARILAVADTVDAMGADRPYRKGRATEEITAELKRCSGGQFDPVIVDAYLRLLKSKVA